MAARELLANPAMFSTEPGASLNCVRDWLDICTNIGVPFLSFHQHLMFMLDRVLGKSERRIFNRLTSESAVFDFLADRFDI